VFEHTKKLTLNYLLCPEGGSPDHIQLKLTVYCTWPS